MYIIYLFDYTSLYIKIVYTKKLEVYARYSYLKSIVYDSLYTLSICQNSGLIHIFFLMFLKDQLTSATVNFTI